MTGVRLRHQWITEILAREIRIEHLPTGERCRENTRRPGVSASVAPRSGQRRPS